MPRNGGYQKKREYVRLKNPKFFAGGIERTKEAVYAEYNDIILTEKQKEEAFKEEERKQQELIQKELVKEQRAKEAAKKRELSQVNSSAGQDPFTSMNKSFAQSFDYPADVTEKDAVNPGNAAPENGDWFLGATTKNVEDDFQTNNNIVENTAWGEADDWNEPLGEDNVPIEEPAEAGWVKVPVRPKASRPTPTEKKEVNKGCFNCGGDHKKVDCTEAPKPRGACHKCNEEGHFAKDCPNQSNVDSRACRRCGEQGHLARECPNQESTGDNAGRACYNCHEEGHLSKDCPNAGSEGPKSRACYNCQQEGHLSRDCPEPRKENRRKPMKCYNCQAEGHQSRNCPEKGSGPDNRYGYNFGNAGSGQGSDAPFHSEFPQQISDSYDLDNPVHEITGLEQTTDRDDNLERQDYGNQPQWEPGAQESVTNTDNNDLANLW